MRGNAPQVVEDLWAAKEEPPAKLVGFSFSAISGCGNLSCVFGADRLACMLMGFLTVNVWLSIEGAFKHVPPWRRGRPEGRGWIRLEEAGSAKQIKGLRQFILRPVQSIHNPAGGGERCQSTTVSPISMDGILRKQ